MATVRARTSFMSMRLIESRKLATTPSPAAVPAGIAKLARSRRKRSGRHGPVLGASARKNAGMPIVMADASVRWRGRNG